MVTQGMMTFLIDYRTWVPVDRDRLYRSTLNNFYRYAG